MNDDLERLEGLTQIAGLAFRAAQAEMATLARREADLRRNLAQLTESKSTLARSARRSDEAALIAGADMRWHQWVDQRRATINAELAQVFALMENCREKLRQAYGKDQAAEALFEHALLGARTRRRKRSDYES
ncbi:MAG: hypothetical protein AAFP85_10040 [Pseudomonadota bacterium]